MTCQNTRQFFLRPRSSVRQLCVSKLKMKRIYTLFCGLPSKKAFTLSAAILINLVRASLEAHEIWGVK